MSDPVPDFDRILAPRQPGAPLWCHFDPEWYRLAASKLGLEPDATSPAALRRHYLNSGAAAGLSPNIFFDEAWYRQRHPDVARAIAAGRIASGYGHYCAGGYLTHTPHWLYDEDTYAASTADLDEAALAAAGCANRYDHYLKFGAADRIAHPLFEPARVRPAAPGEPAGPSPFERFLRQAWASGLDQPVSPCFDPAWFRARYPALAAAIAAGRYACALHAYLSQGGSDPAGAASCDPLAQFSEAFYRATQPEAAAAIAAGAVWSGYEYFLKFGVFALHPPAPGIDLAAFLAANPDAAAAIARGTVRDAFAALLLAPTAVEAPAAPAEEACEPARPPEPCQAPRPVVALAQLSPRVLLEIEEAIICPPHGLTLAGWVLSAPDVIAAIHLCCGPRRTALDLGRAIRIARPDVEAAMGGEGGIELDPRSGFLAHLPNSWQPEAACRLEVETASGETGGRDLRLSRLRGMEAMRFLLDRASVRYDAVPPAFDHVLGPSIAALNAARLSRRPTVDSIAFGPQPHAPALSVIVTLYGRIDFMEYQLGLLSRHEPALPVEFLYVLDDPPKRHETEALAASLWQRFRVPLRLLLPDRNTGYAPANNIGLAHARGDAVCFLNSDVFPVTPDWMERLVARLAENPRLGAIGPLLVFEDGSVQHQGMRFERLPIMGGWHFPLHDRKGRRPPAEGGVRPASAITGACLMLRRDLAMALGGFDEAYPIGDFEDADLCMKLRARGLACAVDLDTTLLHLERQSQAGSAELWRRNITLFNAWLHERRWADALREPDAREPGMAEPGATERGP